MTTNETYRNKRPLMQIKPLSLCQDATHWHVNIGRVSQCWHVNVNGLYKAALRCSEMLKKPRFLGQTAYGS